MQAKRTVPSWLSHLNLLISTLQAENKSASRARPTGAEFENRRINGNSTKKIVDSLTSCKDGDTMAGHKVRHAR
jgi:hypothetical protein